MPIYEYKCDCGAERDVKLPFSAAGREMECTCGRAMSRKWPTVSVRVVPTGRGMILDTLNKEEGAGTFPGGGKHDTRYSAAMSKSLDQTRPVEERVFTGF